MISTLRGHENIVQYFINLGVDINKKNLGQSDALMTATIYGHPHIVQLLLEAGAEVNDKNVVGYLFRTALLHFVQRGLLL